MEASNIWNWINPSNFSKMEISIVAGAGLFAAATLLYKNWDKILAKELENMTKDFNKICKDEKTKLFQRLNEKAKESDLPMKVLEIGGGTGANFEFISEPINWTTIEPNEHCNVINVKNQKNWDSKFEFGGIIQGFAEDLSQFPDDTFDAVIETLVLCSVNDVDQSLREIQRVLKPSGTFFFLDHIRAPVENNWTLRIQNILTNTFWPSLVGNCHLNRAIGKQIQDSRLFSSTEIVEFTPIFTKFPLGITNLIRFEIYGWATK